MSTNKTPSFTPRNQEKAKFRFPARLDSVALSELEADSSGAKPPPTSSRKSFNTELDQRDLMQIGASNRILDQVFHTIAKQKQLIQTLIDNRENPARQVLFELQELTDGFLEDTYP